MRSGVSSPGRSCGKAEKSLRLKLGGKIVTGEMCIRIFVIATAQIEIFRVSKKNGHSFYFCDYSVCCRLILKLFGSIAAKEIRKKTHISKFLLWVVFNFNFNPSRKQVKYGYSFNDFPENQLTNFLAVYTVKANRGPKFCH